MEHTSKNNSEANANHFCGIERLGGLKIRVSVYKNLKNEDYQKKNVMQK